MPVYHSKKDSDAGDESAMAAAAEAARLAPAGSGGGRPGSGKLPAGAPLAPARPPSLATCLMACLQYGFVRWVGAQMLGCTGLAAHTADSAVPATLPPPNRRRRRRRVHPPALPSPASIAITLFNRAVFSVYAFNFPSLVTLLQILISLAYMYGLRAAGRMQFAPVSLRGARKVRPPAPSPRCRRAAAGWNGGASHDSCGCRARAPLARAPLAPLLAAVGRPAAWLPTLTPARPPAGCRPAGGAAGALLVAVRGQRRHRAALPHGPHVQVGLRAVCFGLLD